MRTLEITTRIGCPASCICCPQAKLLAAYEGPAMMSSEIFCKVLEGTPTDVRIDFSGMCEPFANPEAVEFLLEAHESGYLIAVFTTGLGLTVEAVRCMVQVPFDTFELHLQDKQGISTIPQSEELVEVIDEIRGKLTNVVASDLSRIKKVSRAGNVPDITAPSNEGPLSCRGKRPQRFVVLPDGRAVLCCMDYSLQHVCGDITEVGYDGLSLSEGYLGVRAGMAEGPVLCRSCEMAVAQ